MPRALRGDHHHIHIGGGLDQLETDVEAVGEAEHLACTQVGCDFLLVDVLLEFVWQQDHDPVGLGRGIGHAHNFKAISLGFLS